MSIRRLARPLLEPILGAAFAGLWIVAEFGRVPSIPVFVLFGAALALSRLLPLIALGLVVAGLAASTAAAAIFPLDLAAPFVENMSWLRQMSSTDWPAYAAALAVPALAVANARTRSVVRASLAAVPIAALWLAALIATASPGLSWSRGRLIDWLGNGPISIEARVFVTFSLILLVFGALLWLLAWGLAGASRFIRAMLRDPLIRVRVNDALRLTPESPDGPKLTARERDVLLLVADGKSNAEIARALYLSEATVKSHLSSILSKLSLKSRTEIAAHAWKTGLVRLV